MATHSSILSGWQSMGSQMDGHNWASTSILFYVICNLNDILEGGQWFPRSEDSLVKVYPKYNRGCLLRFLVTQNSRVCLQCGRPKFNPWVRKIPWRRKWQPTPVFLPGKSNGRRRLAGYSPWGRKESDTTKWFHFLETHYQKKPMSVMGRYQSLRCINRAWLLLSTNALQTHSESLPFFGKQLSSAPKNLSSWCF